MTQEEAEQLILAVCRYLEDDPSVKAYISDGVEKIITRFVNKPPYVTTIYNYADDDNEIINKENPLYGEITFEKAGIGVSVDFHNHAECEQMDMVLTRAEFEQLRDNIDKMLEYLGDE